MIAADFPVLSPHSVNFNTFSSAAGWPACGTGIPCRLGTGSITHACLSPSLLQRRLSPPPASAMVHRRSRECGHELTAGQIRHTTDAAQVWRLATCASAVHNGTSGGRKGGAADGHSALQVIPPRPTRNAFLECFFLRPSSRTTAAKSEPSCGAHLLRPRSRLRCCGRLLSSDSFSPSARAGSTAKDRSWRYIHLGWLAGHHITTC